MRPRRRSTADTAAHSVWDHAEPEHKPCSGEIKALAACNKVLVYPFGVLEMPYRWFLLDVCVVMAEIGFAIVRCEG